MVKIKFKRKLMMEALPSAQINFALFKKSQQIYESFHNFATNVWHRCSPTLDASFADKMGFLFPNVPTCARKCKTSRRPLFVLAMAAVSRKVVELLLLLPLLLLLLLQAQKKILPAKICQANN